jgi:serine phosphatase RsbU (regulator of sigma subunit)
VSAREIIASLYSAVLQFANGTEQQDDLTAVIVKRDTA